GGPPGAPQENRGMARTFETSGDPRQTHVGGVCRVIQSNSIKPNQSESNQIKTTRTHPNNRPVATTAVRHCSGWGCRYSCRLWLIKMLLRRQAKKLPEPTD